MNPGKYMLLNPTSFIGKVNTLERIRKQRIELNRLNREISSGNSEISAGAGVIQHLYQCSKLTDWAKSLQVGFSVDKFLITHLNSISFDCSCSEAVDTSCCSLKSLA